MLPVILHNRNISLGRNIGGPIALQLTEQDIVEWVMSHDPSYIAPMADTMEL